MRRTSKPVFGASVKGEVRSGNAFSGTCRKPLAFFEDGRNAEPRKWWYAVKRHVPPSLLTAWIPIFAAPSRKLSEPWASGILQSSLPVSLLKLLKRLLVNPGARTERSLSIAVLTWTFPDCTEAVKVEKEKNSYLLRRKNRAGRAKICHALMDNFCEPRKPVPFKTSGNTLRCCLCPLKIFSRCRGAFHPFRATAGNVKKLGENGKIPSGWKKDCQTSLLPLLCSCFLI